MTRVWNLEVNTHAKGIHILVAPVSRYFDPRMPPLPEVLPARMHLFHLRLLRIRRLRGDPSNFEEELAAGQPSPNSQWQPCFPEELPSCAAHASNSAAPPRKSLVHDSCRKPPVLQSRKRRYLRASYYHFLHESGPRLGRPNSLLPMHEPRMRRQAGSWRVK